MSVDSRRRTVLSIVIGLVVAAVVVILAIALFAGLYLFTAQEMEISDELLEVVVTAGDAAEWFEMEVHPEFEEWDSERYFDRSAQVYYYYHDEAESIYINCNLTYEPKASDALMSYSIDWGSLKLTNRVGPGDPIELEEQSELFRWGDASRFAFQTIDGERYGIAFVTRKDGRVFFLDMWGLVLEDREEIAGFLTPHLEALERVSFRAKAGV